jgi:peptidyl-prolyl cis-trans isomerase A (cyclophilin A)
VSIFTAAGRQEKPKDEVPKVLLDPSLPEWKEKAPDTFRAKFTTSKGDFTILVERAWSPLGADRFHALVKNGYYDDVRFFRVIGGFMAQFGLHGAPEVNKAWREATIKDDPVVKSNLRGWVTYAKRGPDTRTTQVFINFKDNKSLDSQGFPPFGQVVEGMDVVDKLYSKYGDGPPRGSGPNQDKIRSEGNAYRTRSKGSTRPRGIVPPEQKPPEPKK